VVCELGNVVDPLLLGSRAGGVKGIDGRAGTGGSCCLLCCWGRAEVDVGAAVPWLVLVVLTEALALPWTRPSIATDGSGAIGTGILVLEYSCVQNRWNEH
jgi:hypothetical protein